MANTIINSDKLAAASLANLEASAVLAATVQKQAAGQFDGTVGHAVNIRRPAMLVADEGKIDGTGTGFLGAATIKTQSLNETVLAVKLTDHVYSAVALNDAELSLEIPEFAAQVALPQTDAVVDNLERKVAKAMTGFGTDVKALELDKVTYGDNQTQQVVSAEQIRFKVAELASALTATNVPTSGRYLVLGAKVAGQLLNDPNLVRVSEAGTGSALREAVIGKLFGFTLIQSNHVDAETMYAYHPSAIQLVTRAPMVPPSIKVGSSQADSGYALRWVRDYDSSIASERSFFSTFVGVVAVDDKYRNPKTGAVEDDSKVLRGLQVKVTGTPKPAPAAKP
ncbi:P22 phage major capsid protein family protein [Streptomyces sp. NPDC056883]|uniref:P22 phage major capsid protein family protein n=1 Tax=Streptomyces sp. NPDC056883 TaxID=3345959 RepID=UPI0036D1ADA2